MSPLFLITSNNTQHILERMRTTCKNIKFADWIPASHQYQDLIRKCLVYDWRDRYGWAEVLTHPLFRDQVELVNQVGGDWNWVEIGSARVAMGLLRREINRQNISLGRMVANLP